MWNVAKGWKILLFSLFNIYLNPLTLSLSNPFSLPLLLPPTLSSSLLSPVPYPPCLINSLHCFPFSKHWTFLTSVPFITFHTRSSLYRLCPSLLFHSHNILLLGQCITHSNTHIPFPLFKKLFLLALLSLFPPPILLFTLNSSLNTFPPIPLLLTMTLIFSLKTLHPSAKPLPLSSLIHYPSFNNFLLYRLPLLTSRLNPHTQLNSSLSP